MVHVMPNNAAIVIGLLYADGDAFQAMRIATECGLDTDCNSGNAGAIMGAYLGQQLLPFYIKRFIKGQIFPAIKDWEDLSLINLANRTLKQTKRFEKL
jgi:ADP-ribosylglycohydrolase